jgi:hypothetical protein
VGSRGPILREGALSSPRVDSIGAMNVFVQVCESGSLVNAGRALGTSASAVGKSLAGSVATGKSVPCPLGWNTSSRLWYQAEAHELHQNPTYKDVANATLAAGKKQKLDLVGIACAWASVGVLGDADLASLKIDCTGGDYAGDGRATNDGGGSSLVHGVGSLLHCGSTTLLQ